VNSGARPKSVSFVIPCLNEENSLPLVLGKIRTVCQTELADRATEIVVADNGSTDQSVAIARANGARVVDCPIRGYGAALRCGITHAAHDVVVFADADDTYDFLESPLLLNRIEEGYDMVIGSRLGGDIRPGAMSFLHRRIGTPALNWLINLLYARRGNRINDCNSGYRAFAKAKFMGWGISSDGMEFASEMLVKAMKAGARMAHVPITYHAGAPERRPNLKTWRDGTRHFLQILLDSPEAFHAVGVVMWLVSWAIILAGWLHGAVTVGSVSFLSLHSMLIAYFGTLLGAIVWGTGLVLSAKLGGGPVDYQVLARLEEDKLFWYSVALLGAFVLMFSLIFARWAAQGFSELALEQETLVLAAFGSNGIVVLFQVFAAHLIKRA
jgi:glycosyltransferase involved in cell wall biosynthesis